MKAARIRQLESEIAGQKVEFDKLKAQYQKIMKQLTAGSLSKS